MVKNLKFLREKNGLSQLTLAKMLGITQQTVNKYENHTTEPDISTLIRLADIFDTSVDFLVGNTQIERKYEVVYGTDLNAREMMVMERYRETDKSGQNLILSLLKELNKENK